jgi:hypothetical protein
VCQTRIHVAAPAKPSSLRPSDPRDCVPDR